MRKKLIFDAANGSISTSPNQNYRKVKIVNGTSYKLQASEVLFDRLSGVITDQVGKETELAFQEGTIASSVWDLAYHYDDPEVILLEENSLMDIIPFLKQKRTRNIVLSITDLEKLNKSLPILQKIGYKSAKIYSKGREVVVSSPSGLVSFDNELVKQLTAGDQILITRDTSLKLTVGMATYDDLDGVYFSVQALQLYQRNHPGEIEIIVIDNNPDSPQGKEVQKFMGWVPNSKYIKYTEKQSTSVREQIFKNASADFVLCMDSHVMLEPKAISKLIEYNQENPDSKDLISGPILYDDLRSYSTHLDDKWGAYFHGQWQTDQRAHDPLEGSFDIAGMGLACFACRKDAWPGFNDQFIGFGGEEHYIHEKFRQNGGRCLCVPFLNWNHRFYRIATGYRNDLKDRYSNYIHGRHELRLKTDDVKVEFERALGKPYCDEVDCQIALKYQKKRENIIQTFWPGGELTIVELNSIESYLENGYEVHLYSYKDIPNLPAGVKHLYAGNIVDESLIGQLPHSGYRAFSAAFKYKVLHLYGGWWSDLDLVCLKRLPVNKYLFGHLVRCEDLFDPSLIYVDRAGSEFTEALVDAHDVKKKYIDIFAEFSAVVKALQLDNFSAFGLVSDTVSENGRYGAVVHHNLIIRDKENLKQNLILEKLSDSYSNNFSGFEQKLELIKRSFENMYCINLNERPEKWRSFCREMARLGLIDIINRFSAIKVEGDGHKGCCQSHVSILKKAKESGWRNVMIFEDDLLFLDRVQFNVLGLSSAKDIINILHSSIKSLTDVDDWSLFYWGGVPRTAKETFVPITDNIIKVDNGLKSTHAYAVNSDYLDKIISDCDASPIIDQYLCSKLPEYGQVLCAYPLTVTQMNSYSDTNGGECPYYERALYDWFYRFLGLDHLIKKLN